MRKVSKLLSLVLAFTMLVSAFNVSYAADLLISPAPASKIVIIHTNDVHGQIDGYAKVAALKEEYEKSGAKTILIDAGDFSQGQVYVSSSKGADAVSLMNSVGYDIAKIGNHELDYGFAQLKENIKNANFDVVAANVKENGNLAFNAHKVIEIAGTKIGFFGLATPETATKANPKLIEGVTFGDDASLVETAKEEIKALKDEGCDLVVCIGHLGVDAESVGHQSLDVIKNAPGIDLFIDGHSHTVIDGLNNEYETGNTMIVSTGTAFANIGTVTIENKKMTPALVAVDENTAVKAEIKELSDAVIAKIEKEMGAVFATSEVELNGEKAPGNRNMETNNGDLICDALLWKANIEGVKADCAITNGGGIRAAIKPGDVTKKDINTVLPFGNTLSIVQIKGSLLLEALEASTYSVPTAVGGFPQVAGIKYTINTSKAFDAGENYPGSTYAAPKSINRVTITEINGAPFDANKEYIVVTNDFTAAGGDTYYRFQESPIQYDLGFPMDEVVMEYVTKELNGKITKAKYGNAKERINIVCDACLKFEDVDHDAWFEASVASCLKNNLMNGTSETTFDPTGKITRGMFVTMLYNLEGKPEQEKANIFDDVTAGSWYEKAVIWAKENNITNGTSETTFDPDRIITREEMASLIYRYLGSPKSEAELAFKDKDSISSFALDAVTYCNEKGIMTGVNADEFSSKATATRSEGATVLDRLFANKAA